MDEELSLGWASECRKYFIFCNIVANASAVLFRKEVYAGVGGADESFQMCGDWSFGHRWPLGGESFTWASR